ncbi:MAG: hypothetical protein JXQ90_02320 [Cyclobacteriaceae bacterium]
MSWVDRLKEKWNVKSMKQFVLILIVFACTGTTVVYLKKPIIDLIMGDAVQPTWFKVATWIIIFPLYNVILLFYGFVFGQFEFFWAYEKKMIGRFKRKKHVAVEAESDQSTQ